MNHRAFAGRIFAGLRISGCLGINCCYTLSLPIGAAVIGCSSQGHWDDDLRALDHFTRLADSDMQAIRDRAAANIPAAIKGPALEYWKRQDGR